MNDDLISMAAPVLGERELEYVSDALRSGWISSQGGYVRAFEAGFASYCGVAHAVTTSSGTAALHLALAALKVGPGDEVLIPSMTHIAVPNMVLLTGATPVLVDSERATWGMDPEGVASCVTPRTRVVMPVHLYGHPVNMDPIQAIADQHGVAVIEDAAEAHGAEYRGRRAGSLGDVGCFSFYANKLITTGEGGMLVTDDPHLAARARKLKDQAYEPRRFWHRELGFNYRMTNLQAAVGLAQLDRLDEFVATRRRNAALYTSALATVPGLELPPEAPWARSVFWMFTVLLPRDAPLDRDECIVALRDQQIESRPAFHPVHLQPLYRSKLGSGRFPVAEDLGERGLNLPSGNDLSQDQVARVAERLTRLMQPRKNRINLGRSGRSKCPREDAQRGDSSKP